MNDQKKNFLSRFLDHPYISAVILVAVFFALRELMIAALGRGLSVVLDHTNLPEYAAIEMLYWSMTIMALVVWVIYYSFRKKYLPVSGFKKRGFFKTIGASIVMFLPVIILDGLLLGARIASGEEFWWDARWAFYAVSVALCAGVYEEIICRALPVGNGMRIVKSRKQMIGLVIITALVFGGLHLFNLRDGSSVGGVVAQTINAAGFGFVFAAIFLRTGSIIPGIFIHMLHDLVSIYSPSKVLEEVVESSNITMSNSEAAKAIVIMLVLGLMWMCIGLFMLRKSKWNLIKSNFDIEEE